VIFPETPEPLKFYLDKIKSAYIYNEMVGVNDLIVEKLRSNEPERAFKESLIKLNSITSLSRLSVDLDLVSSVPERILHYNERRNAGVVSGIPCGWIKIDEETTGWQNGELTFLVGRPGTFKTWILLAWACNAWIEGYLPLIFSKEMGVKQLARRIDTYLTATRFKDIKTGLISDQNFTRFKNALASIYDDKHSFILIDSSGSSGYDIEFIKNKVREYRPSVVFVDGAYLLKGEGRTDWEKQTYNTRELKKLAIVEDIPVVGTTQANRKVEGNKSKINVSNPAYSDSYGQDADNMLAINRIWDKISDCYTNNLLIELIKVRDGENIKLNVTVDLDIMRIFESDNQVRDDDISRGNFYEENMDEDLLI
jgi:replicative DNA helicase